QPAPASAAENLAARRRSAEARAIQDALAACGYNRQQAARALGLHKSTLFRKIRALGIALPEQDGRSRDPGA
ncbi:MAG: Fis family transcriptional regulator, partial [Lentisphaerae bacterium]|nr:Fis family transcriptional regulator [Lentisphaerota bacterium]